MVHNSKPIFITGATGSIGSFLARRLSESGMPTRLLVRSPARAAALQSLANVEIIPGDLSQPGSLRGCLEGCSLVYHCAAKLAGSDRAAFQAINVRGTQALLTEAIHAGIERFIHVSTIGVYGFSRADNITEEFPWPACKHLYFTTKQEAERAAWAMADQIPVTVARLGDVFGPGQYTWTISFIQKINQGLLRPPSETDTGMLNPVYIENLVDALLLLGTHPAAPGQIFNVVDGTPIRISDYIRRLARMAGKAPFAVPGFIVKGVAAMLMAFDLVRGREASVTPGDVDYLLHKATISPHKIRTLVGWHPAVGLEEAFRCTEDWLRGAGYLPSK